MIDDDNQRPVGPGIGAKLTGAGDSLETETFPRPLYGLIIEPKSLSYGSFFSGSASIPDASSSSFNSQGDRSY